MKFMSARKILGVAFAFAVLLAATAAIVVLWGPKTLARFRFG